MWHAGDKRIGGTDETHALLERHFRRHPEDVRAGCLVADGLQPGEILRGLCDPGGFRVLAAQVFDSGLGLEDLRAMAGADFSVGNVKFADRGKLLLAEVELGLYLRDVGAGVGGLLRVGLKPQARQPIAEDSGYDREPEDDEQLPHGCR